MFDRAGLRNAPFFKASAVAADPVILARFDLTSRFVQWHQAYAMLSIVLIHTPRRSIEIGSAEAMPTRYSRSLLQIFKLARSSISTRSGRALDCQMALATDALAAANEPATLRGASVIEQPKPLVLAARGHAASRRGRPRSARP